MVIRLDKYLCDMQAGTRSAVKDIIRKKRVTINGEVITRPEIKVDIDKDVVAVDNNVLGYSEYEYYMLNKPAGVVSAVSDKDFKTVVELITDNKRKDLFPVGRLDKDTEGFLLLTVDGETAHSLLAPGKHVEKKYYLQYEGTLCDDCVEQAERGIDIGEKNLTRPAVLKLAGKGEAYLTICEGKFHQVKRMIAALGGRVSYLKRISMGSLELDKKLQPGDYRMLTEEEIDRIVKGE